VKKKATRSLPHSENERQLSVNNFWSWILGNQGIARMYELITVLLTTLVLPNITHKRKNIDYKIANVATCNEFKNISLDVSWAILITYSYRTAKARALYECTDGSAGQRADNPSNSDVFGAVHPTVPELPVVVYYSSGRRIASWFGSDQDPDPKWRSGTLGNTSKLPSNWVIVEYDPGPLNSGSI